MEFIREVFEYTFLSNALIACVLSGLVCGLAGTYVICRRIVFLSGGITHSSFGGIGAAYYYGINPIAGAVVAAVLSALCIERISENGAVREDSAIGIVWSVGMALGIIFIYLTPGYAPNLMSFLFGSILTVTSTDLWLLGGLCVVIILLFTVFSRPIIFTAFDRNYARSQGMPVRFISYFMSVIVALTIVFSIRTVGIVLLISLLTIPAVAANSTSDSFGTVAVRATLFAILGNVLGLVASYRYNVPAGAAAIFVLVLTLILVKLLPLLRKKNPRTG